MQAAHDTDNIMPVAVKICCIQSVAEARLAIDHGAAAVGLVGTMPSGPGPIGDDQIAEITNAVGDSAMSVLLTSQTSADGVCGHVARTEPRAVQLVDEVDPDTYDALRNHFPDLTVLQVIHVRDAFDIVAAQDASERGCQILLDSGAPDKAVKELGGTGRTHDWSLSRKIVETVDQPVWLAGGLNPENVMMAIRTVRPFGVDLCSALRPKGALDPLLLKRFMDQVVAV